MAGYINEAYNRLLAGQAKAAPAEFPMFPTAEDFEERAKHIKELRSLWVEYLHSLATDGAHNQTCNAITSEVAGFVGDALSDFAGQFEQAAEMLREDEPTRSDYQEHNTHCFALSGAK